jgi:catechol 2,3-dioxygenase-like lactoylglutathione lyase family enzyme
MIVRRLRLRSSATSGNVRPSHYLDPMETKNFESLILYVADLVKAKSFYVDALGLPVLFEDEIAVVAGDQSGRLVLHRNDRGHDDRGVFPAGSGVGGAAVRFAVDDPDACEREALAQGLTVLWPTQEAAWGRFVVLADPDGRSVVLARMRPLSAQAR